MRRRRCDLATTNSNLANRVLELFLRHGVDFAILHGADQVREGAVISDLDLVVRVPPSRLVSDLVDELAAVDLHPVVDWEYDVAGTRAVFLATHDASDGLQLDLLHDPAGRGRYGVRSAALLDRARVVDGLPVAAEVDELVYLLRKRAAKGDRVRFRQLQEQASRLPPDMIFESCERILVPTVAGSVTSAFTGEQSRGIPRPVRAVFGSVRRLRRVARASGYWVHLPDEEVAADVVRRFGRFLPYAEHVALGGMRAVSIGTRVIPIRLRPGLVATTGPQPRRGPDLVVDERSQAPEAIVAAMTARTTRRLAHVG